MTQLLTREHLLTVKSMSYSESWTSLAAGLMCIGDLLYSYIFKIGNKCVFLKYFRWCSPRPKNLDTILKKPHHDNLSGISSQLHCLRAIDKWLLNPGNLKQVQTVLFWSLGVIPANCYLVGSFNWVGDLWAFLWMSDTHPCHKGVISIWINWGADFIPMRLIPTS